MRIGQQIRGWGVFIGELMFLGLGAYLVLRYLV